MSRRLGIRMKTFVEILAQLKQLDEIELVELLGVNSEDLIDRFVDLIEANPDKYEEALNQWFDSEEENEDNHSGQ